MEIATHEPQPGTIRLVAAASAASRTRAGAIGGDAVPETPPLTAREIAVLNALAAGLSDREVALKLMVFEPAVRVTLRSIYRKLRVSSRQEAAAYAMVAPAVAW